jgi:hypothetical protein
MSTPPWFSRRMYRILQSLGINSTLEEVPGKEHWWWDTLYPNDGGALNDMTVSCSLCFVSSNLILLNLR